MANRQPPVQQPPPVQRLRLRYAKRATARFSSHRDFSRAFDRALRRAGVPMAFSSGFNPHQRVSYANAAPTGAASEAEYLELGLAEVCDPQKVKVALNAVLPPGFEVLEVVAALPGSLSDRLEVSHWRISLEGVDQGTLGLAVAALLAAESVEVSRMTKSGLRTFDARGAIVRLVADGDAVDLLVRQGTPLVRPDDVLSALRQVEPALELPQPLLTRLSQGPLVDDQVGDPLC